jgi:stringent starvation protein B
MMAMTSNRPYLIRAFLDWIVDNDLTPHISVNALEGGVEVPQSYVSEGQIVLNIAPRAVMGFDINNERIIFNGRFGGIPTDIYIPVSAVMGIYAQENGQGMVFPPEDNLEPPPPSDPPPATSGAGKSRLRVVK